MSRFATFNCKAEVLQGCCGCQLAAALSLRIMTLPACRGGPTRHLFQIPPHPGKAQSRQAARRYPRALRLSGRGVDGRGSSSNCASGAAGDTQRSAV